MMPVTPGFFETMSIPRAGGSRIRQPRHRRRASPVVLNEAFASRYFGRDPAVGRILETRFGETDQGSRGRRRRRRYEIRPPQACGADRLHPAAGSRPRDLHVRVTGDPAALGARLREEVRAASPLFRVTTITTQSDVIDRTLLRERLMALLAGFFALVGLVLAAVGLYGVLSYSVVQRTREIGIRMALGARQLRVVRTVFADASGAAVAGAIVGLAGGLYASRFVETLLFEVTPLEFWSLALPLGTLLLTAALAATLPALRAARVDPVIALRYE